MRSNLILHMRKEIEDSSTLGTTLDESIEVQELRYETEPESSTEDFLSESGILEMLESLVENQSLVNLHLDRLPIIPSDLPVFNLLRNLNISPDNWLEVYVQTFTTTFHSSHVVYLYLLNNLSEFTDFTPLLLSDSLFNHFGGFIVLSVFFEGSAHINFNALESALTQSFHDNALLNLITLTEDRITTSQVMVHGIGNVAIETESSSFRQTALVLNDIDESRYSLFGLASQILFDTTSFMYDNPRTSLLLTSSLLLFTAPMLREVTSIIVPNLPIITTVNSEISINTITIPNDHILILIGLFNRVNLVDWHNFLFPF